MINAKTEYEHWVDMRTQLKETLTEAIAVENTMIDNSTDPDCNDCIQAALVCVKLQTALKMVNNHLNRLA